MAIAEWFGIIFDAETDQANKKIDDLSKATEDYTDKTNSADFISNKFSGSLLGLAARAAGVLGALFSVGAIMGGISNSIAYADSIGETAEALGVATDELSAWSDAAGLAGGSAQGLQNSIRTLSREAVNLATTGNSRVKPFFDELGVSLLDSTGKARNILEVLPEIAEQFEGLGRQEAIGLGQRLGLDQGTIMLLQQGRRGVEELVARQRELGTVSQEDAEVAAAFNDALDDTAHAFRTIYTGIATTILPAFTWFLEKLQAITRWAREHRVLVTSFFTAVATAITVFYLPAMIKAAAATLAATWPFILIAAVIAAAAAAIALIAEDIYVFLKGGNSLIGQVSQKWPIIGKTIEGIRDWFIWLFDAADKVITFFSDMWNSPQQALEDFKLVLSTLWNDFIDSVPGLRSILDAVVKIFEAALAPIKAVVDGLTKTIRTARDTLVPNLAPSGFKQQGIDAVSEVSDDEMQRARERRLAWEASQNLQKAQQLTPTIASMGNSISNANSSRSSVNNNVVNINGSNLSQQELETAIDNAINKQVSTASSRLDDSVSH